MSFSILEILHYYYYKNQLSIYSESLKLKQILVEYRKLELMKLKKEKVKNLKKLFSLYQKYIKATKISNFR